MEQMMECLLAEIKTKQERLEAKVEAKKTPNREEKKVNQEKMEALQARVENEISSHPPPSRFLSSRKC
jgi:hypothetical protein